MIGRAYCSAQALCVAFTMLLAACGGGGGGSASDPSTAPGLTVSPASISFTAVHDGAIPPTQNIQITISRSDAALVGLAVPADPATWLHYPNPGPLNRSGNHWTYTAALVSPSLAPGPSTTRRHLGSR